MFDPSQIALALTFDDVLLVPGPSSVLPNQVSLGTRLADSIELALPLLSSAMDTVTEAPMAIALARLGGLGVIHKNLSAADQASQLAAVKSADVRQADGSLPVAGARPCLDGDARLQVAAAVGAGDVRQRAPQLVEAGVDLLVVDSAHGHAAGVLEAVAWCRDRWPDLPVLGGNVATPEGTQALIEAGATAVKVGVGPGSICTTRVVAGVGVPQLSAILDCAQLAGEHQVPLVADGGIARSGDITKALAAGAAAVMVGSLLAGTDESPGRLIEVDGRRFKIYRGMGSVDAMAAGSADRYGQAGAEKLVAEGIIGRVPARGPVAEVLHQLMGGLRAGMGYTGATTLVELQRRARFVRITGAGLRESHPHDLALIEAAPNYQPEATR